MTMGGIRCKTKRENLFLFIVGYLTPLIAKSTHSPHNLIYRWGTFPSTRHATSTLRQQIEERGNSKIVHETPRLDQTFEGWCAKSASRIVWSLLKDNMVHILRFIGVIWIHLWTNWKTQNWQVTSTKMVIRITITLNLYPASLVSPDMQISVVSQITWLNLSSVLCFLNEAMEEI